MTTDEIPALDKRVGELYEESLAKSARRTVKVPDFREYEGATLRIFGWRLSEEELATETIEGLAQRFVTECLEFEHELLEEAGSDAIRVVLASQPRPRVFRPPPGERARFRWQFAARSSSKPVGVGS